MLIDTHAHLYLEHFDQDRDQVIQDAVDQGVNKIFLPNIDSSTISSMLGMEKNYPGTCFPMMGLHPCSVKENYKEELETVKSWLERRPFFAVGEIGIDLYWDTSFKREQDIAFRAQIEWAKSYNYPIVIHSRDSIEQTISTVKEHQDGTLRGVFHCFTSSLDEAKAIVDLNFYMGIGGVVTFKNGGLDKIMDEISLEHIVLETDAPYLTPVPYRGKRNQSAYIPLIANRIAQIKGKSVEEVSTITSQNANNLFSNELTTKTDSVAS